MRRRGVVSHAGFQVFPQLFRDVDLVSAENENDGQKPKGTKRIESRQQKKLLV